MIRPSRCASLCSVVVCVSAFVISGSSPRAQTQSAGAGTIVLWTSATLPADIHGNWLRISDATAAGGAALQNTNRSQAKTVVALAAPATYFDVKFDADSGVPYHLWLRMRAQSNATANDSVHLQFSDSVDSSGQAAWRMNSTQSAEVVLQAGAAGATPQGWGWSDNGWDAAGVPIYFAAGGSHTLRIQQREDGAIIDQIVLSPDTFVTTPPGSRLNDETILPANGATPSPPPSSAGTSVIWTADVPDTARFGAWERIADATAAGGAALRNSNAGMAKVVPALANPASYFEASFKADAETAYHVWVRLRADGDAYANDSVHLQFNDSLTPAGAPFARIGTSNSAEFVLQDGSSGAAPHGWGWTENGWDSLGPAIYFASRGDHTVRVQQREDGAIIDQIVISPDAWLTSAPGSRLNDTTILPATSDPNPPNLPPSVAVIAPASGATFTAPATIDITAAADDPENRLARVEFYAGSTLLGADTSAPYAFRWTAVTEGNYVVRAVATDDVGASTTSGTVTITVAAAPDLPPTAPGGLTATASSSSLITLAWTASTDDRGVTGYRVERCQGPSCTAFAQLSTTGTASFSDTTVASGTSYSYRVRAADAAGNLSGYSNSATAVTATVLPAGQQSSDIGAPAMSGSETFSNGTYRITAGGSGVWSTADRFRYIYQPITGDVDVIARVASVTEATEFANAGVMIRESLAAGSRNVFLLLWPTRGYSFNYRAATDGVTTGVAGTGPAPGWVRLTRAGSLFTAYRSADGQTWTTLGSVTVAMGSAVYAGIAATSNTDVATTTAVVDNLSVTIGTPANQPPTASLTAPVNGASFTAPATIAITATASDPENRLARVEFYAGSTLLGSDTTAPYAFTWSGVAAGSYVLSAVAIDQDGGNGRSSNLSVTVGAAPPQTQTVMFTASSDHASRVVNYVLEVFAAGADPGTATPVAASDLGKPSLDANGEIAVDRSTFLNALPAGAYVATVSAVSAAEKARSAPYAFTR